MTVQCVLCGRWKLPAFLEPGESVPVCLNWEGCRRRAWASLRGATKGHPKDFTACENGNNPSGRDGQLELLEWK